MKLIDYINKEERAYLLPFMGTNVLKLIGYTLDEVYNSPEKQLEAAILMDNMFESDFVYALDDASVLYETLGIPMKRSEYAFPIVAQHPITNSKILRTYKIPDPYKDGRMKTNLKTYELISNNFNKPLMVSVPGPFTVAGQLCGIENFLKNTIKNPEYAEELLTFCTSVILKYVKAIEKAGVKFISIAEPSSIMISPKVYEKLVSKNLKYIYKEMNCWKGIHICGDTTKILDFMIDFGVDAISLDQIMDIPSVASRIPEHIVIIGNIDPINVLGNKQPDEVKEITIKLIKDMRAYNNYIVSFGCTCLNNTPVENIKAVTSSGRMWYCDL